jgi:hypothetical protein
VAKISRIAGTDMIVRAYLFNKAGKFGNFRKRWSGKTDRAINAAMTYFLARQKIKQQETDKQIRARQK